MWKAPGRAEHKITQDYNDGLVTVFSVSDEAEPGTMPIEKLTPKIKLRYAEQRLGINRYYMGMQNQIRIERIIRVQRAGNVSTQDAAMTEDGKQYRIDLVQTVPDVYPTSLDLTLYRVEQKEEAGV